MPTKIVRKGNKFYKRQAAHAPMKAPVMREIQEVVSDNLDFYHMERQKDMIAKLKADLIKMLAPVKGHQEYYRRLVALTDGFSKRAAEALDKASRTFAQEMGEFFKIYEKELRNHWVID